MDSPYLLDLGEQIVAVKNCCPGHFFQSCLLYTSAYEPGNIRFLSSQQFAYAAALFGIMAREKPAANFMMGAFWAEALMLAEVGSEVGALQITGTAQLSQVPFFVASSDYTLIGEELSVSYTHLDVYKRQILLRR